MLNLVNNMHAEVFRKNHTDVCNLLWFFFFFFLAALGLHCCAQTFSSCGKWGPFFVAVCGLLIVVASLVAEHGL